MNSTEILQNLEKPKDNIIKTIQNIHDLRAGKYWRLRNPIIICAYYALGKTSFANRYWREFVVEDADAGKYAEIRDSSDHYIKNNPLYPYNYFNRINYLIYEDKYGKPIDVILLSYSMSTIYTLRALLEDNFIYHMDDPYKEYIILMPNNTPNMHKIMMDRIKSRNPCSEVIESMDGKLNAINFTNKEIAKVDNHLMIVGSRPARLNPLGFNYIEYAIEKVYGNY